MLKVQTQNAFQELLAFLVLHHFTTMAPIYDNAIYLTLLYDSVAMKLFDIVGPQINFSIFYHNKTCTNAREFNWKSLDIISPVKFPWFVPVLW